MYIILSVAFSLSQTAHFSPTPVRKVGLHLGFRSLEMTSQWHTPSHCGLKMTGVSDASVVIRGDVSICAETTLSSLKRHTVAKYSFLLPAPSLSFTLARLAAAVQSC